LCRPRIARRSARGRLKPRSRTAPACVLAVGSLRVPLIIALVTAGAPIGCWAPSQRRDDPHREGRRGERPEHEHDRHQRRTRTCENESPWFLPAGISTTAFFAPFLGDLTDHGERRGVACSDGVTRRSCRDKLKPRDNPRPHGGPAAENRVHHSSRVRQQHWRPLSLTAPFCA
jgi:hypothetical protein